MLERFEYYGGWVARADECDRNDECIGGGEGEAVIQTFKRREESNEMREEKSMKFRRMKSQLEKCK